MNFRLAHITDLHWRKHLEGTSGCHNRKSRLVPYAFEDALQKMKAQGVEAIAITGDLIDVPEEELSQETLISVEKDYLEIKKLLDESGLEYVSVPGNHDHLETYFKVFGADRKKTIKGYEFVCFFDHAPWPEEVFRKGDDLETFEQVLNEKGPRNQIHLQHYLLYTSIDETPYETHLPRPKSGDAEKDAKRHDQGLKSHANADSRKLLEEIEKSSRAKLLLSGHFHYGCDLLKIKETYAHVSPSFSEGCFSYAIVELSEENVTVELSDLSEEMADSPIHFTYEPKGEWKKGGLHTHCKESSGCAHTSLLNGVEMYSKKKYDFLAITDHDKITDLSEVKENHPNMIFYEGYEHSVTNHMLFISEKVLPNYEIEDKKKALVESEGELTIICHPQGPKADYWMVDELATYPTLPTGVEVFNGHYGAPGWRNAGAGWDYTDFWVSCLDRNMRLLAYSNDDFHEHEKDFSNGWNVVFSPENSSDSYLSALKTGSFYATTGLDMHGIHEYRGHVVVNLKTEGKGSFLGPDHEQLSSGRGTTFEYEYQGEEYIRFEAEYNGKKCWSQAFFRK